jgi:hypothetical protein
MVGTKGVGEGDGWEGKGVVDEGEVIGKEQVQD